QSQVIFRWWKISLRSGYQSTKPGEVKESHEDFRENSHLQIQIALVFGARILDYVFNLCEGRIDFLERLSDDLLTNIISYLGIEDIASLSLTSHRFSKLCTSDKLWEPIIEASGEITPAMKALAQDPSWRQKFFIRKLHLCKKQNQKSQADSQ
ncbi:F-box only protein 36, partial [Myotis davidii]